MKTISQFVPKDIVVKASVGHIVEIKDSGLYNMGVDPRTFEADFVISSDKKDTVKELKELVKKADEVILSTDLDREGESIAWHLKEQLKIPAKKIKRCGFLEITKKAVIDSLADPQKIDNNLVDAALTRSKLDKIVGYRLSPIARRSVFAKSVGRCQSAALKIVVDREREILAFDSKTYYELWLTFNKDRQEYKAQYKGLLKDKKNTTSFDDKSKAEKVLEECNKGEYILHDIISSDRKVSPKPPFTTSTYQQEVSSKLGYSVKKAQELAQRLFEGISIGGQHVGLISYPRTDSTALSDEFVDNAKQYIEINYGKDYYVGVRDKKKKKEKNVQGAHESIHPTDLSMTPEKLSHYINDNQMLKVYEIIYNRTLASLMEDAIITDTDFIIVNGKHKFIYTEHAIKYPGWKKAYNYEEEDLAKSALDVFKGEKIKSKSLDLLEKKTNPPKRFSEATLVKQLEASGVGRPSTFSSIISILLDKNRGYCEEQGKAIVPTELGMKLIEYLEKAFPDIVDINYSSNLETKLDEIAKGKLKGFDFLTEFYADLEESIKNTKTVIVERPAKKELEKVGKQCPKCGKDLVYREGRYGKFIACSGWKPYNKGCNYSEKI